MSIRRSPLAVFALGALLGCVAHTRRSEHTPDVPAHRMVVLVPSLVEDAVAIGAAGSIVCVSHFTGDISAVNHVDRVADFSSVDVERIVTLHPDVIVGIPSQARLLAPLRRLHFRIVLLKDDSYADIFGDIQRMGVLTGRNAEAAALVARLQATTAKMQREAGHFAHRPRVFVALGTGPIWTVGPQSYIATLITLAGGTDAVTSLPSAYAQYSAESLLALQPDVIITDPAVQLSSVLNREPWRSLRAVREHHVYVVDPPAILQRPGPRYTQGLAWLIEHLRESLR